MVQHFCFIFRIFHINKLFKGKTKSQWDNLVENTVTELTKNRNFTQASYQLAAK